MLSTASWRNLSCNPRSFYLPSLTLPDIMDFLTPSWNDIFSKEKDDVITSLLLKWDAIHRTLCFAIESDLRPCGKEATDLAVSWRDNPALAMLAAMTTYYEETNR